MFEKFITKDFSGANNYIYFQNIVREFQAELYSLDKNLDISQTFTFQHTKDKNGNLALWITYVSHPNASLGEHSASKIFMPFTSLNDILVDKENKIITFGKIAIAL